MPANLPPQYHKLEEEFRKATAPQERLDKLREMFRLLPKHKGTEKLQSDLKQRISRLRDDLESGRAGGKKGGLSYKVAHEGAGQVVLVGPPNSGKSSLLAALTNASPTIAPYPYTTRTPQPGLMAWQDVGVQLIDLPPISHEMMEPWVPSIIRSSDAALLVADLSSDDVADQVLASLERLEEVHTELVGTLPFDNEDEAVRHVPTLLVANKVDAEGALERLPILEEFLSERFPVLAVSAEKGSELDVLRSRTYDLLGVIRVYTKAPGKPADHSHPFTLPRGSTVLELARAIHRDLEHTLKYAKVWGTGVFEGQTVKRDHELHDADLVELHV